MAMEVEHDSTALDIAGLLDPRTKEFQEAVRLTPATLAHYRTKGKWIPAKHLLFAAAEIATEIAKGDARIIFEMPPRHGKSELASVHTPTWFLDRWAHLNVILCTYASDLSTGFGRRVRDTFVEDGGRFLRAKIREDVQRTDLFQTVEGGGMMSVGIGGPITGRGANLLIIDDYVKNFAEAMSEVVSEATWNWFTSTAYTRLEPGGSCIVLATRWPSPQGDLIGRIIAKEPGVWRIIRFPAFAEKEDVLGRLEGEALWPERGYTIARLERIRSLLSEWLFNAMYQQDPKPVAGMHANTDMFRFVDIIDKPELLRWVRSWDLAGSKNKGDYTVGALVGSEGKPGSPIIQTYVADMVRGQWAPSVVEENMQATAEADGHDVEIIIEQEPGSAGKGYAQHLATNVLAGYNVTINPASANKLVRAQPYMAAVDHGRICLVRATWNDVHIQEMKDLPTGKHDDTIDAIDQGYNHLFSKPMLSVTWGRSESKLADATRRKLMFAQPRSRKLVKGCVFGRST